MNNINALFLRPRGYGKISAASVAETMSIDACAKMTAAGYAAKKTNSTVLIRWGSRMEIGHPLDKTLNVSSAIKKSSAKGLARAIMSEAGVPTPKSVFVKTGQPLMADMGVPSKGLVRPNRHFGGKNMFQYDSIGELFDIVSEKSQMFDSCGGFYISEIIQKVSEYRVFVVQGRVTSVIEKIPEDAGQLAWNFCQGSEFSNVKWGNWHLPSCFAAVKAAKAIGLDFAAVDVIVDADGAPYVLELNTSPSLLRNSTGEPNYHARKLADALTWACLEKDVPEINTEKGWRGYIHPSIWPRQQQEN